jgi:hypothetical protein
MSPKDQDERLRRVCQNLRDAFADIPCPGLLRKADLCGPLTRYDMAELREHFYSYEPEVIQYLLPLFLIDLIDTDEEAESETVDAEGLVLQLNPFWLDDPVVRSVKLRQFSGFTIEQAAAICEWLQLARMREELKDFVQWVDNASEYWCRRAQTH